MRRLNVNLFSTMPGCLQTLGKVAGPGMGVPVLNDAPRLHPTIYCCSRQLSHHPISTAINNYARLTYLLCRTGRMCSGTKDIRNSVIITLIYCPLNVPDIIT